MEKIRRGNAKSFVIQLDEEGKKVSLCIYKDGREICEIPSQDTKQKGEDFLYTIKIEPELSGLLGDENEDKEYSYEMKIDDEPFEENDLLIVKNAYAKKSEDGNQDSDS